MFCSLIHDNRFRYLFKGLKASRMCAGLIKRIFRNVELGGVLANRWDKIMVLEVRWRSGGNLFEINLVIKNFLPLIKTCESKFVFLVGIGDRRVV